MRVRLRACLLHELVVALVCLEGNRCKIGSSGVLVCWEERCIAMDIMWGVLVHRPRAAALLISNAGAVGDAATAVDVAAPGLCDERSVETGGWSRLHKCVDAACIWLSVYAYVCVCLLQ